MPLDPGFKSFIATLERAEKIIVARLLNQMTLVSPEDAATLEEMYRA